MKFSVVAGLDIGSRSLRMAAVRHNWDRKEASLLGIAEEASDGVRKGAVVNADAAAEKIAQLKTRLESMAQVPIEEVVVNVGGSHLFTTSSRGIVAVSRADNTISQEDVDRVLQAAQALSVPANKEIMDVYPQQFIVDGAAEIKEAVGLKGMRLEAEVIAIGGFSPYLRNLQEAVLAANLEIADTVPAPLAASASALTPQQRELGVALVDIGASTTSLAVFEEGELLHAAVFPVGSEHITNDIAIGLQTEPAVAERIKRELGTCLAPKGKKMEKIELGEGEHLTFPRRFLSHIIEERARQILQAVQGELKQINRQGKLPAGVVLAGGGVKIPAFAEFAKKELKLSVKVGRPEGIEGFPEDPAYLAVAGLVEHGLELMDAGTMRSQGFFGKVKKLFKPFVP